MRRRHLEVRHDFGRDRRRPAPIDHGQQDRNRSIEACDRGTCVAQECDRQHQILRRGEAAGRHARVGVRSSLALHRHPRHIGDHCPRGIHDLVDSCPGVGRHRCWHYRHVAHDRRLGGRKADSHGPVVDDGAEAPEDAETTKGQRLGVEVATGIASHRTQSRSGGWRRQPWHVRTRRSARRRSRRSPSIPRAVRQAVWRDLTPDEAAKASTSVPGG